MLFPSAMAALRSGVRRFRRLAARIAGDFFAHGVTTQGAALAFYALFSIAPVLLVVIWLAGFVRGREAVETRIVREFAGLVGPESGRLVEVALRKISAAHTNAFASALGVATLFSGATGFFAQLQGALNTVWGVAPEPGHAVRALLRKRLLSFALLLGVGFLLLVSLALSAALHAIGDTASGTMPVGFLRAGDAVLSFGVVTVLLAMIYRTIPDAEIRWRDVWLGALTTALSIEAGKWGIGAYLGRSAAASPYGAAGSIVLILLWVYYASVILLVGAEFTHAHTLEFRLADRPPSPGARRTVPPAR